MSLIRDGLLALLLAGPAYRLQLANELAQRTGRPVNTGQVYLTLDRLERDGLITEVAHTDDGLRLLAPTDAGRERARRWLTEPQLPFEHTVFQLLLARSLPGHDSGSLLSAAQAQWAAVEDQDAADPHTHPSHRNLVGAAQQLSARAALDWLDTVAEASDQGWPLSSERPPRGRRARPAPDLSR